MIASMLAVRLQSFRNAFTRTHGAERRRAWTAPVWSAVVAVAIGWASYKLFSALFAEALTGTVALFADRLPGFALMGAFWMLVLSGVSVGIQHLFVHREITLLLAAPLHPRTVFVAKFVDMTIANAALFALTGGPLVVTYAMARGYLSVEYVVRGSLALGAFCAIPTALGVLIGILVMRALPAHRLRDLLAALGLAVLSAGYVALNLAIHRMQGIRPAAGGARSLAEIVNPPIAAVGPWAWAGEVLVTPSGYPEPYIALGLLAAAAALSLVACAAAAERLHWRGWSDAQEAAARGHGRSRRHSRAVSLLGWMPAPVRAYMLKDLRSLARDMRQMSLLLMPAAVVVVFLLNLRAVPEMGSAPHGLVSLAMLPLVAMIALRIASSAFVSESGVLWLALASPAGPRSILLGKLFYTSALTLPMALAAMAAYGALYSIPAAEWWVILGVTGASTIALSGIGVGVGGRYVELSAESGRPSLSGVSRMVALGLQLVYSAVVALLLTAAWFLADVLNWPSPAVYSVALLCVASASALAVALPLSAAGSRLERLEAC